MPVQRIVSLVPSLTESIAFVAGDRLVGVTDWCTHPAGLEARRVRGTKNPDLAAIIELAPDLVVANREENRRIDVQRLRDAGLRVWVSEIDSLPQAIQQLDELLVDLLGCPRPGWLDDAERAWSGAGTQRGSVAVPIWRDPWMVIGGATFSNDLLDRAGWRNVFAERPRYPHIELAEIAQANPDQVWLPDEPYPFGPADADEFAGLATRFISGRLLTWYGPSLLEAARVLR